MATWELCSLEVRAFALHGAGRGPWSWFGGLPDPATMPCRLDSNASAMLDRSACAASRPPPGARALRFQRAKLPGVVGNTATARSSRASFVAAGAAVGHGDLQIAGSQRVDHRDAWRTGADPRASSSAEPRPARRSPRACRWSAW